MEQGFKKGEAVMPKENPFEIKSFHDLIGRDKAQIVIENLEKLRALKTHVVLEGRVSTMNNSADI